MATVNFLLRTKKNPANINVRFSNGRKTDIFTPINIFIDPKNWDKTKQKIKNVIEVPDRDKINSSLLNLKSTILSQYNSDYGTGEIIDKEWLDGVIKKTFNRPKEEKNKQTSPDRVYFVDFAEWWIDHKSKKWKTPNNSYMSDSAKKQYESHIKIVKNYEKIIKERLKFKTLTEEKIHDFINYMEEVAGYEYNTVKRHIKRFKFFCNRAEAENIAINHNYKDKYFASKKEDVLEPYLNENEIEKIFKFDFSNDQTLNSVRDNFIIGLWTGLRVSDFNNNLNLSNIHDDFIDIKTQKTNSWVSIPLHPQVKFILSKRGGLLPEKLSDQKFNKHIKTICQLCDIDNEMEGKLFDAETKRNKVGIFPKYKLISSHICRRSFATNLYGLVPNQVIQAVGGWGSEKMMLSYIKKTKREHAEILRDTWNKKYNLK